LHATYFELNDEFLVEPYYQFLYDVPVIRDSTYSMLNFEQDFHFNDALVNSGKGQNMGIDLTFEKYFDGASYCLITTSLFRSVYETSTGEIYPTRYDKGYVINLLAGKDIVLKRNKNQILSFNGRLSIPGGNKTTPVDQYLSMQAKKVAGIFTVEVKNLLGNPSGYNHTYNYKTDINMGKNKYEIQNKR